MTAQASEIQVIRRIGRIGLLVSLLVLGAITLKPTTVDQGYGTQIAQLLRLLHRLGFPAWFGYNELEFTANCAMFVPLGVFLAMALAPRLRWLGFLILPALSAAIELIQLIFLPARFATVSDVVANSLGAWAGVALVIVISSIVHPPPDRSGPTGPSGPTSPPRAGFTPGSAPRG